MSDDSTSLIRFGSGYVALIYPEVYFQFVSTLYRDHDDLVRAMTIAKVTLRDGSALDFLNLMLGTTVTRETPMELGYSQLLDALNSRIKSKIDIDKAARMAADAFKEFQLHPHLEEKDFKDGGGLFAPIEQVEEDVERRKKESKE